MTQKKAGVLLPISALESPYGIGSLGKSAFDFVDFLALSKLSIWQILPLTPTGFGDSPYQSVCANALNPYFIDLDILAAQGLLDQQTLESARPAVNPRIDYAWLFETRIDLLKKAFLQFNTQKPEFEKFKKSGEFRDFAIFMALKEQNNYVQWSEWKEHSIFDKKEIDAYALTHSAEIDFWQWTQFEFSNQWQALLKYAHSKQIEIFGDMPIYVAYDSVEVWKNGEMFLLDEKKVPTCVAGVPPDYFSKDGQLWGNPIYDWEQMRSNGFSWWNERIARAFKLFDIVRIDHFRAMDRFYSIKHGKPNARVGKWENGVGFDLFADKTNLNIVAEDLGTIDNGVKKLIKQTGFPGMRVLQFCFDINPRNTHKPSVFDENVVAYTGTHDNATLLQFFSELSPIERSVVCAVLQNECARFNLTTTLKPFGELDNEALCDLTIELLFASKADRVIAPLQDFVHQGKEGRINFPSTLSTENWSYRLNGDLLTPQLAAKIAFLCDKYDRSSSPRPQLGVNFCQDKITALVWSPTAKSIVLRLYPDGENGEFEQELPLIPLLNGYFQIQLDKSYLNKFYTFLVDGKEVVDPYVKAVGVNGKHGQIIDLSLTDPVNWKNDNFTPLSPIIWEMHVRDFSIDENLTIQNKGQYGAFRTNAKTKHGYSALVDYLKELGVTYVQLQPITDFCTVDESDANARNWGYDPECYFAIEGSYSSNPYDGYARIREFKRLVQTLHNNSIGVIMDVVYNHTYRSRSSALEVWAKDYFYRKLPNGHFYNASGCGNELASEREMTKRIVLDSLKYFVEEFHIDGFRFDLMAIFDITTLQEIRDTLDKEEKLLGKKILTYGEPWSALPVAPWITPSDIMHLDQLPHNVGIFNNTFRDGLRGDNSPRRGFLQGNIVALNAVVSGIEGACAVRDKNFNLLSSPSQQIVYMSAHDDYCLQDQLTATGLNKFDSLIATKIGAFIVMSSLGMPFMLGGEEFRRTKLMDKNSYKSSDTINKLDWSLREENDDLVLFYKGLIDIRKHNSVFDNLNTAPKHFQWLTITGEFGALAYRVGTFIYCVNPTAFNASIDLTNFGKLRILADFTKADFSNQEFTNGNVTVFFHNFLCLEICDRKLAK
ncbi:MAG: type I pullulanase [Clostridia bacterium]